MKEEVRRFLLAVLALGAGVCAQGQPVGPDLRAGTIVAETDVEVLMRDGTAIRVDVFRPAGFGRHPALYLAGPFAHEGAVPPSGADSGPLPWYVDQGYAVVLASTRGTGGSTGEYAFLSRDEQQDHYELIEWIAAQPWSNQRVAAAGAGYYATSQWLASLQRPPHLDCIAPFNGTPDPYRDAALAGGIASDAFVAWYEREIREANAFANDAALIAHDPRFEQLAHPLRDEYWRLRSSLEGASQVSVPVLLMGSWGAAGLDSSLRLFSELGSLARLLLLDDAALYASTDFHAREVLPFYEWCLKGEGESVVTLPTIRYQPVGKESLVSDSQWPPAGAEFAALHLSAMLGDTDATGTLDFNTPGSARGAAPESELGDAPLRFVSPALQRALEIAGPLMLELYVETTGSDAGIEVRLLEEGVQHRFGPGAAIPPSFFDPEPREDALFTAATLREVSVGRLRASLRAADEVRGEAYRPFHSFTTPQRLQPGRVYRLDIALDPVAWRFRQGSRLAVEVRSLHDGALRRAAGEVSIHHDGRYPTRMWLPLLDADGAPPYFAPESANGGGPAARDDEGASGVLDLLGGDDPVILVR